MIKPVEVNTLKNYHLYIKFSDGVAGEVDLSEFAGKAYLNYGMTTANSNQ